MLTNKMFRDYLLKCLNAGWVYWYGTYGKPCTLSLYKSKKKQYPAHYGDSRTKKYMQQINEGRWCADCIGLGKSFVWSNGQFETNPKYAVNGMPDKSADGMFEYAKKLGLPYGKISTIPEVVGVAVRFKGHVGYYIGNGEVIEERGFAYGCVKTKLKDRKWTDWYYLPAVTYEKEPEPAPTPVTGVVYVDKGNYYVRTEPSTKGDKIGVATKGSKLPYLGETQNGWFKVLLKDQKGWISNKCGSIE